MPKHRELGRGLLRALIRDAGLTREGFLTPRWEMTTANSSGRLAAEYCDSENWSAADKAVAHARACSFRNRGHRTTRGIRRAATTERGNAHFQAWLPSIPLHNEPADRTASRARVLRRPRMTKHSGVALVLKRGMALPRRPTLMLLVVHGLDLSISGAFAAAIRLRATGTLGEGDIDPSGRCAVSLRRLA